MNPVGFISSLRILIMPAGLAFCAISFLVYAVYNQFSTEADYRNSYGESWRQHYEAKHGSLSERHTRLGVGAIGAAGIAGLSIVLYKRVGHSMRDEYRPGQRRRSRRLSKR